MAASGKFSGNFRTCLGVRGPWVSKARAQSGARVVPIPRQFDRAEAAGLSTAVDFSGFLERVTFVEQQIVAHFDHDSGASRGGARKPCRCR